MQFNIILHVIFMSFGCHLHVTHRCSYVIYLSLAFIGMPNICHSHVLVYHLYVTRPWFYYEPIVTVKMLCKMNFIFFLL